MFQVQPTLYQAYRTKITKHTLLVKMATRAKESLEKYLHFFCNTFLDPPFANHILEENT